VHENDLEQARQLLKPIAKKIGAVELTGHDGVAKLSVVGIGMRSHSGVAAKLFECLGHGGINIQLISTSEIKIAVVVDEKDAATAARLTHQAFGLARLAPAAALS